MLGVGAFFFFQAEDGIRDWSVTGVQTCALPIWSPGPPPDRRRGARSRGRPDEEGGRAGGGPGDPREAGERLGRRRSEERRVGKEGRTRGAPGWEKKKREDVASEGGGGGGRRGGE